MQRNAFPKKIENLEEESSDPSTHTLFHRKTTSRVRHFLYRYLHFKYEQTLILGCTAT